MAAPDAAVGCAFRFLSLTAAAADACGAGDADAVAVAPPEEGARWIGKLVGREAADADGVEEEDAAASGFAGAAAMDTPEGADMVKARNHGRRSR